MQNTRRQECYSETIERRQVNRALFSIMGKSWGPCAFLAHQSSEMQIGDQAPGSARGSQCLSICVLNRPVKSRQVKSTLRLAAEQPTSPFSAITGKRLPRWTSSLFRRSPSACSIAFSSSVTIVGASCTSMSQTIRQARRSSSSCGKRFHLDPLRGSSSLIVVPRMDWKSPQRFDPSA